MFSQIQKIGLSNRKDKERFVTKKYVYTVVAILFIGVLCSGCGKEKDGNPSSLESLPSPSELVSDIPSAVDDLISGMESNLEGHDSSVNSSSTSLP